MSFPPFRFHQATMSQHVPSDIDSPKVLALAEARDADPREIGGEVADRKGFLWLLLFFVVALLSLLATRASGQNPNGGFDSIPMHPKLTDENLVKQVQAATKNYVTTGNGNPNMANGYFSLYIPARMTAPDGPQHISELVDETNTLLSRAVRSNRPQVAQQLTKFIFDGMSKVAVGNYNPPARINAALILSRLDRQPANTVTRTPPIPLIQTFPILLKLYLDENNVDGVRAAALQGLHRHVAYGFPQISPEDKATLTTAMTTLLDSDPPQGRSPEAHAYLQRFAVDILDILRAKQDKSLGAKLISISTEPKNPSLIALYSASRIGSMGPELKGQINQPEEVLKSWSHRALDALEGEVARLKALDRPEKAKNQPTKPEQFLEKKTTVRARTQMRGGMDDMYDMNMDSGYDAMMEDGMQGMDMEMDMQMQMGMGMSGMYGMMGRAPEANPQPPEVVASRRKINHALEQLHRGVTGSPTAGIPTRAPGGLLASVADDKQTVVTDWIAAMEPIVTAINEPLLDTRKKYLEGLEAQVVVLREFLGLDEEQAAMADAGLPDELAPVAPFAAQAPAGAGEQAPAGAGEQAPAGAGELAPVDELAAP